MITPLLSRRIEEIRRCRPELAVDIARILSDPAPPELSSKEVEITPSRLGPATLKLAGRSVHSRFDPLGEAQKRLKVIQDDESDGYLLVGLGLGYFLDALGEEREKPVVVVVFLPSLLERILREHESDWWCTNGPDRIVPAWLPGVIPVVLRDTHIFSPVTIRLDGIISRWPDLGERVVKTAHTARERNRVNRNTLRRFGKLWVRNGIRNLALYGALDGIDDIEGAARGIPTIVVGAGPTLDSLEGYVHDLFQRHLVIAVDTALPVLQRWGVAPHIAVVSDPQYWNTRHLDQVRFQETVLIVEPATHPRTLRLWSGPIRVSASLFPVGAFFDQRLNRRRKLGAGGSVATSAWDLARLIGSDDIALAGIDLGFPRSLTHCGDSFFENRLQRVASRTSPAEHGMSRYLHGADARPVPTSDGGEILSDKRMEVYRSWFSEQTHRYPETRTVLLSPESSAIGGVGLETPEDRIARLQPIERQLAEIYRSLARPGTDVSRGELDTVSEHRSERRSERRERASNALEDLATEITRICDVANRGLRACSRLETTYNDDPRRVDLSILDEIDGEIGTLGSRELVGFLAADGLEAEIHRSIETPLDAIHQSRRMYEAMLEAGTYHLSYIKKL